MILTTMATQAPRLPPSFDSPKPKSMSKCRIPATRWYMMAESMTQIKKLAMPEDMNAFALLKPSDDRSELSNRHKSNGILRNNKTPVIRCKIDTIAVDGNRTVVNRKFTGLDLFTWVCSFCLRGTTFDC